MMFRNFALILFAAVFLPVLKAEDILVEKSARHSNPSVTLIQESAGAPLQEAVRSSLLHCGWFDVIRYRPGVKTDYAVRILGGNENEIRLRIENSAGAEIGTVSARGDSADDTAHAGIDAVLKAVFRIPGICRSQIVFTMETGKGKKELYVCDFDGRNIRRITENRTISMDPVWTPDGRTIIYSYYGGTSVSLVQYDTITGRSRKLSRYSGLNAGGAVSPDGKSIALVLNRDNQVDLYVRGLEGGELRRITRDAAVEASPCWSPDGKKICFVSDASGRPLLYLADASGRGKAETIRGLAGSERVTPCWSPSGKLTYSAKTGRNYIIAVADMTSGKPVMEPVGGETSPLSIPGEGPSWAPDGRHVAVADQGMIWIVDTWLGKKRPLFKNSGKLNQPDWSPLKK